MSKLGREEDVRNQKMGNLLLFSVLLVFIFLIAPVFLFVKNFFITYLIFGIIFLYSIIIGIIYLKIYIYDGTGVNEFILIGSDMESINSVLKEIGFIKVKDGYYCPIQPSWGFFVKFDIISDNKLLKSNDITIKTNLPKMKMTIYKTTSGLMKPNIILLSKIRDRKVFIHKEFIPPEKKMLDEILLKINAESKYDITYNPTIKIA